MKLDIAPRKTTVYSCRFDEETFEKLKRVAKQNKSTPSKVIQLFVKEGLATLVVRKIYENKKHCSNAG